MTKYSTLLVLYLVSLLFSFDTFAAGYAWCHLPTTPGEHMRELPVFRPGGSVYDDVAALFVGGHPRYQEPSVILTPESRTGHGVQSVGIVKLNVSVVLRGFGGHVVFA